MSESRSVLDEARASLEEGNLERAREALRRAVEQDPTDSSALVDLGYLALGAGDADDAATLFRQALERDRANIDALRALATIHARGGRGDDAFEAASAVADAQPDDPLAALEVADLALDLGRLDEAENALRHLRTIDDEPAHEVFTIHALIEVELRRESWRRALDLAVEATRVDRLGRTTDVLAFVVAQVFGEAGREIPTRAEIEAALESSRDEHRRLHLEAW